MRIAEIATLARPVPPDGEGSVELLVYHITEELVRRGHEVTLYATANSKTSAKLESPVPMSYCQNPEMWDWQLWEACNVREAFLSSEQFDIIHCHSYHHGLMFSNFVNVPSLHSVHIQPGSGYRTLAEHARNAQVVCCSSFQAMAFGSLGNISVVPHGIPMNGSSISDPENYVLFLGRFMPEKGPLSAIEAAREAGIPIMLAAPGNDYYRGAIEPLVDGKSVIYVGEVSGEEKDELLSKALALLYPLQTAEPFGLVLIESLARGVPVVALNRGAVPEIIRHNKDGWVCADESQMAEGIEAVKLLNRTAIRDEAVNQFSIRRMVDDLERLMETLVERQRSG